MANLDNIVENLSNTWDVKLVPQVLEIEKNPLGSIYQVALNSENKWYGYLLVMQDKDGQTSFCGYLGNHPKMRDSKPVSLSVESFSGHLTRTDERTDISFLA